ncbi:PREDICTED: putative disease resistance protein At4g11170 [Camelina sativa]|uniref:Disease resistance protein At4g11170 n=1 Tax=Camelina sativa TaxID=90675 RepID=A0ABM0TLM2_CAMSA|nr:PREDICTED: putative disease resistance protein At4g11170 [Camelina sativa]
MASSLLSSSIQQKCDVFVSFKKSDTGKCFVSHLYRSLDRKGITTFKEELKDQPFQLLQDIGYPKIALVVVSENYISSFWCMSQLTELLKFMKEGSLSVIPIFYEIDPSGLHSITGTTRLTWSRVLTLLASLPGEHTDNWDDDAGLIDKVTDDVCKKLTTSTTPSDYSDLFGMDCHMKALYEMLDIGFHSQDVEKMVGISGVRGVGKTTLARYAYEKVSHNFYEHVFLENVYKIYQERSPSRLQEEFLSKLVLQSKAQAIKNSKDGSDHAVKSRLVHRKVLFIADGVDTMEQVEDVWKVASWLGQGSRVIITTQDSSLFVAKGLENVYEVKRLRYDEALQFFYQFAFKQQPPHNRFKQLSVRATKVAGCLPLSLKILGSFLNGKSVKDWEIALQRLEAKVQDEEDTISNVVERSDEPRRWSRLYTLPPGDSWDASKKKKQRQQSKDDLDLFFSSDPPMPRPPPPPPSFERERLFSYNKIKIERGYSTNPWPPPKQSFVDDTHAFPIAPLELLPASLPLAKDRKAPQELRAPIGEAPVTPRTSKPTFLSKIARFLGTGSKSPVISIPTPPGDYVRMASDISISSDEPDDPDVAQSGEGKSTDGSLFCPIPDIDTRTDDFIARFRAKLELDKDELRE